MQLTVNLTLCHKDVLINDLLEVEIHALFIRVFSCLSFEFKSLLPPRLVCPTEERSQLQVEYGRLKSLQDLPGSSLLVPESFNISKARPPSERVKHLRLLNSRAVSNKRFSEDLLAHCFLKLR